MLNINYTKKKDLIDFHCLIEKNGGKYNLSLSIPITPQKRPILESPSISCDTNENNINDMFNDKENTFDFEDSSNENVYFINNSLKKEKKNESIISTYEKTFISKKTKINKSKRKRGHSKFEKDNIMKKINIHFISFIVKYVNYKIKIFLPKNHPIFTNLTYNFKEKINNNIFNGLKKMSIGEVLKNEGSNKNKRDGTYHKDDNEKVFNLVYNTELKELLDMNYIHFFRKIYVGKNEENDIEYFKKHNYPKNLLFFDDFLKSEAEKDKINGELYKERLKNISKSEFINEGFPFFQTKILCKKNKK